MEKKQTTIYLTGQDKVRINKLTAFQFALGEKTTMSEVISKAIKDAYEKRFPKEVEAEQ